ncbi:MAG: serine/threonine-protein kinase [Blastocatellia bacterium]
MTPERYQRIKQIFQAAVDRPPTERPAWLEEACVNDAELRREVESLLADADEVETKPLLDSLALPALPNMSLLEPRLGQLIGPYKILRELGHGGMGTVYLAERADEQFKQRVAVKVVKRGMDSEEILARFRHERQILASLDHPNIARLLDGGTTADALPYFVMEHIEGQPIDVYCNTHKLTTDERLELFRTVCSAVHYAHQNLVVHRDLKPTNILVTEAGTVKLLDFGIAKILNPEMFPETVLPTRTWERPMTPAYASPEQVRGHVITTASDVYALGVILYELLTGQRPYQFKGHAPHEIAKVVCETEPDRPSTAVIRATTLAEAAGKTDGGAAVRLRNQLKGDLDTIVLMALRKEPQRRYASAEQFSEDLRRHLDGLPVIAREDTFKYRTGKFVARNKLAVVVAAVFALLLAGFLMTTLVQSRRIARERDRAQLERDKAERVSAFLADLFKVSDPSESKGNQVTARELLDKGAERINTELKDQPEVQATLMDVIGEVYIRLGLYDQAEKLLDQSLRTRRQLFGSEHGDVASVLASLSNLYHERGEYGRAEPLDREALAIRRKVYGNLHLSVGKSLHDLAITLQITGKRDEAGMCWQESLAIKRELYGAQSEQVAGDLVSYASYLSDGGDNDGAEAALRDCIRILRQHRAPENLDLMTAVNNLAIVLGRKKNYADAIPLHRELLETKRRIYGAQHPDVALTLNNLGNTLRLAGDLTEAEPIAREALAMRRKLLGENHPNTTLAAYNLGKVLIAKGALPESETLMRQALNAIQKANHTEEDVAFYQQGLGESLLAQRRFAESESLLTASFQTYQAKRGVRYRRTVEVLNMLVILYDQWGKPDQAARYRALLSN